MMSIVSAMRFGMRTMRNCDGLGPRTAKPFFKRLRLDARRPKSRIPRDGQGPCVEDGTNQFRNMPCSHSQVRGAQANELNISERSVKHDRFANCEVHHTQKLNFTLAMW